MRWLRATQAAGASAGRHPLIALLVIAGLLHACAAIDDQPAVCDEPNSLQACE